MRWRRRQPRISEGLAVALAGQVAAGLVRGEGQEERARASLFAIGLMISNATDSQIAHDVLAAIDGAVCVEHGYGVTRFETRG